MIAIKIVYIHDQLLYNTYMHALDLETDTPDGDLSSGHALEPWRARQGKARISSLHLYGDKYDIHIADPTRAQLIEVLEKLADEEVFAHYALFDVAWLIASIEPNKLARIPECVKRVKWRDTALLAKWCTNGRKAEDMRFSYSLMNLIYAFRTQMGHEGAEEFIRMKQEAPKSGRDEYWMERGKQDTLWTYRLAKFLKDQLPAPCRRGYVIEQRAIPKLANSWLIGMHVDKAAFDHAASEIDRIIAEGCSQLGLPESVVSSPAQLGRVVFGSWGFEPISKTPTGQPSADADTWIMLAHITKDPRMKLLLKVRQNITLKNKYINTALEALARTGDGYMYGKPNMFGTSSGRLTYSSETMAGLKVAIAQHQIPRKDKIVRRYLTPPPGSCVWESDAMAQESRIMGIWSGDSEIIRIFNENINFHSYMASKIYGQAYEVFQKNYESGDPQYTEWRQMGKLTNLACNFRIGGKSLAKKALTEYDTYMDENDGRKLVRTFSQAYPNVPAYWRSIIQFAKEHGYSYTLAQRRYKVPIEMMNSGDSWKVEGTVISHPIQGTGGEMFYAAIDQIPDGRIQTNMHDGIFWIVDEGKAGQEEADYILDRLNKTPYQELWDMPTPLPIPLLYEGTKVGTSYADVK